MLHSFHLAEVSPATTARALAGHWRGRVPGLEHAEALWTMRLGAPVVSRDRAQVRRLAVFATWRDEADLERFLAQDPLGRALAAGWHVRLDYLRRWGEVAAYADLPTAAGRARPDEPVVAVTVARMRLTRLARFLRWGRPVERFVRDHPGQTLALAAMRPPHTIVTFTIWRTLDQMLDMTHGHATGRTPEVADADRHADAMGENARRTFHHEFTTLRFRCRSEHGAWEGRTGIVPR